MADYALDDAAARALWALRNEPIEHIGLLYEQAGMQATPTQTQHNAGRTKGAFAIPPGSLRGLFHNHPIRKRTRDALSNTDSQQKKFSNDDRKQAQKLGVPSYISAGSSLRRYDPATGSVVDVLAQIPITEIKSGIANRVAGNRRMPDYMKQHVASMLAPAPSADNSAGLAAALRARR